VELKYFSGLTNEEIAEILQISPTTVKRDWRTARLWLYRQISRRPGPAADPAAGPAVGLPATAAAGALAGPAPDAPE
jgi:hypothetical protein